MRRDFDIFEKFPDSSTIWRACVSGQYETQRRMRAMAEHSENEFFAIDLKAGERLPFNLLDRNARKDIRRTSERVA